MFDKDLFLSLCNKYNVELSATNTDPMVRNEDGTYDRLFDRIVDKLSQLELKSIEAVNDEEDIS